MNFNQRFYTPEIKQLLLKLLRTHILGTHHCGNIHREAFKHSADYQDVLCHKDYSEDVVASFAHKIQSEDYGGNIFVFI